MKPASAFGPATAILALLLCACASPGSASADFVAARDAARAYIVSDVAEQAAARAIADIRRTSAAADRPLIDAYLADPAHARQLPALYQDALISRFEPAEIAAMTAWDGDPEAFAQQVELHRVVIAQSLMRWHIAEAELDPTAAGGDRMVGSLAAIITSAPAGLRPAASAANP